MNEHPYSPAQKALQELLRETRKTAGMTQQAVADRLKKPQSFIAKYENGERRLDPIELIRVLEAMKKDPAEFISELVSTISKKQ